METDKDGLLMDLRIIAHRGASGYAPENTMFAIQKAVALGASWIEVDVAFTADNEVVVFHDDVLDRTSSGKGRLREATYQHLLSLDAGSWFAQEFKDEKILTLKQLLEFLRDHPSVSMNIELKTDIIDAKQLAEEVFKLFQQIELSQQQTVLFTSSSFEALQTLYLLNAQLRLGIVSDDITQAVLDQAAAIQCVSLSVDYKNLDRQKVDKIKAFGYQVLAYTVNQRDIAKQLIEYGVDGIFTDYPDLLYK